MALDKNIAVLIGGVGGAKLASGLVEAVPPERLTFIVNTGDDFLASWFEDLSRSRYADVYAGRLGQSRMGLGRRR